MANKILWAIIWAVIYSGTILTAAAQQKNPVSENRSAILKFTTAANDFGGAWQFNQTESDDVLQKMQERFRGVAGTSFPAQDEAAQAEMPALSLSLFAPDTLTVAHGAGAEELIVNEGFGSVVLTRALLTDGKAKIYELRPNVNFTVTSLRLNNKLTVETYSPRGNRMTELYELAAGGSKMSVKIRVEDASGREVLSLRRVYDRTAADIFSAASTDEL